MTIYDSTVAESATTGEVIQLYQAIQYRAPDAGDLATYQTLLSTGQAQVSDVAAAIENDPYTLNSVDAVIREYQAAFNRVPDQAGVAFWVNAVANDPAALASLNVIFANSPEFYSLYGADAATPGQGDTALVSALYQNVLGRAPDVAGLAFWVAQDLTAAQLLQAFSQSPEFVADAAGAVIAYQNLKATGQAPTTGSLFALESSNTDPFSILTTDQASATVIGGGGGVIRDSQSPPPGGWRPHRNQLPDDGLPHQRPRRRSVPVAGRDHRQRRPRGGLGYEQHAASRYPGSSGEWRPDAQSR